MTDVRLNKTISDHIQGRCVKPHRVSLIIAHCYLGNVRSQSTDWPLSINFPSWEGLCSPVWVCVGMKVTVRLSDRSVTQSNPVKQIRASD